MNRTSPLPATEVTESHASVPARSRALVAGFVAGLFHLDHAIIAARSALQARQARPGFWVFELEADCTIPAEYILMLHFLGESDPVLQKKIATYLRARQAAHGGWPLYQGGDLDISCTVKGLLRAQARRRLTSRQRTWCGRAMRSSPAVVRRAPTSSRALHWRSLSRCRGARCRTFRSRSCCCRAGSRFTWTGCPTGRAP